MVTKYTKTLCNPGQAPEEEAQRSLRVFESTVSFHEGREGVLDVLLAVFFYKSFDSVCFIFRVKQ